jgi:hypothetical protein
MASYAEIPDKREIRVEDIRRLLQGCVDRGEVHVVLTEEGYTIYHHDRITPSGKKLEMPIAQLRPVEAGMFQVFWRRGSGRWWPYHDGEERSFVAIFERCMDEITKDPWGCFWG